MNVLKLLLPKQNVDVIVSGDTLRQAVSKMSFHHYSVIPVLSKQGHYLYSVSTGDLLFYLVENGLTLKEAEDVPLDIVPIHRPNPSVPITASLETIKEHLRDQNYAPMVDDKGIFVGIITRKSFVSQAMKLLDE